MTTDPKALIERLECASYWKSSDGYSEEYDDAPSLAAQRLRDLTAENARLKALGDGLAGALERIDNPRTPDIVSPIGGHHAIIQELQARLQPRIQDRQEAGGGGQWSRR